MKTFTGTKEELVKEMKRCANHGHIGFGDPKQDLKIAKHCSFYHKPTKTMMTYTFATGLSALTKHSQFDRCKQLSISLRDTDDPKNNFVEHLTTEQIDEVLMSWVKLFFTDLSKVVLEKGDQKVFHYRVFLEKDWTTPVPVVDPKKLAFPCSVVC